MPSLDSSTHQLSQHEAYAEQVREFDALHERAASTKDIIAISAAVHEMIDDLFEMRAIGDDARRYGLYVELDEDDVYEERVRTVESLIKTHDLTHPILPHKPLPTGERD